MTVSLRSFAGRVRAVTPFLLLVPFTPALLGAQGTGSIRGTVTGQPGAEPLTGVRVAITTPARVALTGAAGTYTLRDLPAGHYRVAYSAVGRTPAYREVDVAAGQSVTLDVGLERGSLLLSSVITTATLMPTEANRVATTVNVMTPEQIRTSPARESQDMLREIPGVELPRTSSLVGGTAQIVSIRGVDEGRTAVLFDGIPVNDAWGEWIDWGRVPKHMLDRVEVVEGGTSNLYGNGAMGGVISFFSRPLAPGAASALVEGGSRDMRHAAVSAGIPLLKALTANVSADYQEGGGYILLDSLKRGAVDVASSSIQRNVYARLLYTPSSRVNAFVTLHGFGDTRHLGTPLGFASRDQKHIDAGLDLGQVAGGRLMMRGWDGQQDEHQRATAIRSGGRALEDSSSVANIPSHDWGASATWSRNGWMHLESFTVGADFRHMSGFYDEVAFNTSCPGANCGKISRTVLSGGDQSLSGAFVQAIAAPITPLRIELSARGDRWTNANGRSVDASAGTLAYDDRSKSAFSPRIGARYQLHPTLAIHSAFYQAFRAPNLAELYRKQISPTSITIPNPDLKPEFATGREVGVDWQPVYWAQLKGTWYVADYKDLNVPVQIAAGPPTQRQRLNVSKARSKGGEAYLALRPIRDLVVSAGVNYDDARLVAGPTGTVVGSRINRVPSPKQTVRVTYTSSLLGTYTGIWRHEGYTTTLQGARLAPFTVVDANAQRDIVPGVSAFVSLENIGDVRYQINLTGSGASTLISYGMPRTIRAGMSLSRF